ncbi:MAG: glycosyltransferase family 4 protein, partial [Chloroflexi bacterium]|nr:glycosyltransferase family 4 protein [Chloroflexota bacterium]
MHIGIDATALPARLYGAANYTVNLVRALEQVDFVNEYTVFAKPEQRALFPDRERFHIVPVPLASRYFRIAWEQTMLPVLAHRARLDVLHSPHYTMPFAAGCASVVTFHDMTFFLYPQVHRAYKKLFFTYMMRFSARHASMLIADSDSTRRDILDFFKTDPGRVTSVPLGVSPAFGPLPAGPGIEPLRRRYHLPEQMILYVGVLEPRKNIITLIRAYARLVQSGVGQRLVIAGRKGWMYKDLFRAVDELGLSHRVLFPGYIPEQDLPVLYNAASVFVYPSLYEGFGLPVLEALACGVPVITSNVSSMPEVAG